jgi:hypothetical protein
MKIQQTVWKCDGNNCYEERSSGTIPKDWISFLFTLTTNGKTHKQDQPLEFHNIWCLKNFLDIGIKELQTPDPEPETTTPANDPQA